jgi:hypothetical protein
MADYWDLYDQLSQQPPPPLTAARPFPPFAKPDEQSLLQYVTDKGIGGLAYLGGSLDKAFGARAIRGVLGGRPEEALSVIPFSDTLGITDEKNVVRGRDLLENAGILGPSEPGLDAGDVAGLATDVALDPATWLTFGAGALSKLGQSAKAAGVLPKTAAARMAGLAAGSSELGTLAQAVGQPAAELAGKPLGGLVGTGGLSSLLGMGGNVLGTGSTAQAVATALDTAGDTIKYAPGVRHLRSLFDYRAGDTSVPAAQRAYENTFLPNLTKNTAEARTQYIDTLRRASEAGVTGNPDLERILRQVAEGVTDPATLTNPLEQSAAQFGLELRGQMAPLLDAEQSRGFPTQAFSATTPSGEDLHYLPRSAPPLDPANQGIAGRLRALFSAGTPSDLSREEIFRNLDTETVNRLAKDPAVQGLNPLQAQDYIRTHYLGDPALPAFGGSTDVYGAATKQAQALADWHRGLDPRHAADQIDFFRQSPFVDAGQRAVASARKTAAGEAIHQALFDNAVSLANDPNAVPLTKVLQSAGLTHEATDPATGALTGARAYLAGKMNVPVSALDNLGVPPELAGALTRYMQPFVAPESLKPVLGFVDSLQNLFKASVTVPFPGFHMRNLVSGAWNNWVDHAYYPEMGAWNPAAYAKPYLDALTLARGETIPGAAQKFFRGTALSDAEATAQLADEIFAHKVAGVRDLSQVRGFMTGLPEENLTTQLPGAAGTVPIPSLRSVFPSNLAEANPLNVAGVAGQKETLFAPVREGDKATQLIEFGNRVSNYLAKRAQGYVPETASLASRTAQYDYSLMSGAERNVMRRLIPFYSFSRRNLPYVLEKMTQDPAIPAATVRAGTGLRDPGQFVPGYIGEGVAVPLGQEDGQQRYLSSFGLPIEDEWVKALGDLGDPRRAMQQVAGGLTPILKYPLEEATGVQLHSGRKLDDLRSTAAGSLFGLLSDDYARPLSQLLSNTPVTRAAGVIDTLMDPRKSIEAKATNLATGYRLTDVDLAKQQQIAARQLIEEELTGRHGVGSFERLYVKPENRSQLTPRDVMLLRLYGQLEQEAQQHARQQAPAR